MRARKASTIRYAEPGRRCAGLVWHISITSADVKGEKAHNLRTLSDLTSNEAETKNIWRPEDLEGCDPKRVGMPGQYPYTRGIHPDMYRSRLWTMRQYAGFGNARETNQRFRYLLSNGQIGPVRRVRFADTNGLRQRQRDVSRRGRQDGRFDRQPR